MRVTAGDEHGAWPSRLGLTVLGIHASDAKEARNEARGLAETRRRLRCTTLCSPRLQQRYAWDSTGFAGAADACGRVSKDNGFFTHLIVYPSFLEWDIPKAALQGPLPLADGGLRVEADAKGFVRVSRVRHDEVREKQLARLAAAMRCIQARFEAYIEAEEPGVAAQRLAAAERLYRQMLEDVGAALVSGPLKADFPAIKNATKVESEIDDEEGRLAFAHQWNDDEQAFGPLKGRKTHRTSMLPALAEILARYPRECPGHDLVFACRDTGKPIRRISYNKQLRAAAERAGIAEPQRVTSHLLRHTAGTLVAEATGSELAVMHFLAHSDPRVSRQYIHGKRRHADIGARALHDALRREQERERGGPVR